MMWKYTPIIILVLLAACDRGTLSDTISSSAGITPSAVELAATTFVIEATQTAGAEATDLSLSTPFELQVFSVPPLQSDCKPGEFNSFDSDLSTQIEMALMRAGFEDVAVGVITTERTADCVNREIINAILAINLPVDDLNNDGFLARRTALILDVLTAFPPTMLPGIERTALSLRFDREEKQRILEVQYGAALQAYADGMREKALLQALGGLQPGR